MSDTDYELHSLASCVHGALSALHLLGLIYCIRQDYKLGAALHIAGLGFSILATKHHLRGEAEI